jgi:hypothetical protein
MADHLWFIPATGGRGLGSYPPGMPKTIAEFNVQWDFHIFPVQEPGIDWPCIEAMTVTGAIAGSQVGPTPSQLVECFAAYRWRSCAQGGVIVTGGELTVGTVFSRALFTGNSTLGPPQQGGLYFWSIVDVWAKFRVIDLTKLSAIMLSINDRSGNVASSGNIILPPAWNNNWYVANVLNANWSGWDAPGTNLRAVLTFQGTLNPANVGLTDVHVEWFAIRLRNETYIPPP